MKKYILLFIIVNIVKEKISCEVKWKLSSERAISSAGGKTSRIRSNSSDHLCRLHSFRFSARKIETGI